MKTRRAVRPRRVVLTWTDPFDGAFLLAEDMPYNSRRSAAGYYTRRVKVSRPAIKDIWGETLQGRTPRVGVRLMA